jgi:hypothetical protein
MWHRVVWQNSTDILEECNASVFRAEHMLSYEQEETGLHGVTSQNIYNIKS